MITVTVLLEDPQKFVDQEAKKPLRPQMLPNTHQSQKVTPIKHLTQRKMPRLQKTLKLLLVPKLPTSKLRLPLHK